MLEFGSTDRETSPTSAAATEIATDNQSATPERDSPQQVTFDGTAANTEPPLSSERPENESEISKQATTTEDESDGEGKKRKKEKKGGKKKGKKKKKKGKGGFL